MGVYEAVTLAVGAAVTASPGDASRSGEARPLPLDAGLVAQADRFVGAESRQFEILDFMRRVVDVNTHPSNREGIASADRALILELERLGFVKRVVLSGTQKAIPQCRGDKLETSIPVVGNHLYAYRPGKGPHPLDIVIVAHMDTVFDPENPFRDFTSQKRDSVHLVTGPGVADSKGSLAVALFALKTLDFLETPEGENVLDGFNTTLFVNGDEEEGSLDSSRIFERLARGERADIKAPVEVKDWPRDVDWSPRGRPQACLVFSYNSEPGKMATVKGGVGKGLLAWEGESTHPKNFPQKGVSVVPEIAWDLTAIDGMNYPDTGVSVVVGQGEWGGARNSVPGCGFAKVDIRFSDKELAQRVADSIQRTVATPQTVNPNGRQVRGLARVFLHRPPWRGGPETERLFDLYRDSYRDVARTHGPELAPQEVVREGQKEVVFTPVNDLAMGEVRSGNDANLLGYYGCPTLDGLGLVSVGVHSERETTTLESLWHRTMTTVRFLLQLRAQRKEGRL
ncbi:MAG: M20/M25/M40 family metallo-hydrolase [Deltaproteobacteria bacterium]|nr:M20/M25/M40 family metallo-hydrolase [Deltaproteobacteria bacterium]